MSKRIDFSRMPPIIRSVMFVCTGNICRSPMAEAIFEKMVPGEADIRVFSTGTHAKEGNLATENSAVVSKSAGLDLSNHRAKRLSGEMVGQADIILAMEPLHIEHILCLDLWAKDKTFNLARFAANCQTDGDMIPDPYGGSLREYQICFRMIHECIGNLYEMIIDRLTHRNR